VIVTTVVLLTPLVVTVKFALNVPPATVTLAGTWPAGLLLLSGTATPPVGASPLSVTVPVDGFPPTTLVGFTVTDDRLTGTVTINVAF
jgi:hypothetical protein